MKKAVHAAAHLIMIDREGRTIALPYRNAAERQEIVDIVAESPSRFTPGSERFLQRVRAREIDALMRMWVTP